MSEREPKLTVHRLDPSRAQDFRSLHCKTEDQGWCQCVAWWVPTWDDWGARTKEENTVLRDELFQRGEYDGYLLYADDRPVGWCQVGLARRLEKLCKTFGLERDEDAWAISCFVIDPARRGSGLAHVLLDGVLRDLRSSGARRVLAFPRHETGLPASEVWTGPEPLFARAGFRPVKTEAKRSVWEWTAQS